MHRREHKHPDDQPKDEAPSTSPIDDTNSDDIEQSSPIDGDIQSQTEDELAGTPEEAIGFDDMQSSQAPQFDERLGVSETDESEPPLDSLTFDPIDVYAGQPIDESQTQGSAFENGFDNSPEQDSSLPIEWPSITWPPMSDFGAYGEPQITEILPYQDDLDGRQFDQSDNDSPDFGSEHAPAPVASRFADQTDDGGPSLARPIVLVTLPDAEVQRLFHESLAAGAEHVETILLDIVEDRINQLCHEYQANERAIWGR